MMEIAGPSHLHLPERPNRWSVDTDQSTPSTVHEMDFSTLNTHSPRDSETRDTRDSELRASRDSGLDDEEETHPGKTLKFLETLQDKIADELRMLEWEMTSKDELLTEIFGYHDLSKNDSDNESTGDQETWQSLSSQSSLSEASKTLSEGVYLADVETSGHTSPLSSNGSFAEVGTLTFFASDQQETPQQTCLDWYVRLLVNSIMRSVSLIFIDSCDKHQWQNLYSDIHLYNNEDERPVHFSKRFTDSNVFFGDGRGGYYDYTSTDSQLQEDGYWYSTEDEWEENQTDGGIPPPIEWQAPWRRARARHSEPVVKTNGLIFENSKFKDEDPRMFHKVRFQMHDIHHHLSKLRNQIHGGYE